MEFRDRRISPLSLLIFAIVFASALFLLPYAFPVAPSVSASFVYQFNNRVATGIFLLGAAFLAIYFRGLNLSPGERDVKVSPKVTVPVLLFTLCCAGLFYWLSATDYLQGEPAYFINRMTLLEAGKTIYRDFEFAYGPLLLYLPVWTAKLLHLSLFKGYFVFWLIDWAIGMWLLFLLINHVDIPSPNRSIVFAFIILEFLPSLWNEGINYAPIRTMMSGSMALLVHAVYKRGHSFPAVAAVAALGGALIASLSPEHGLAFMLGTLLFFFVALRYQVQNFWPAFIGLSAAYAAIVIASERSLVYTTLHSMSTGAFNYPLLPGLANLAVIYLFLMAACAAWIAYHDGRRSSLVIYLICICLFGMPSSFGRADFGHMQVAAFPAVIVGALAASNKRAASIPLIILAVLAIGSDERNIYSGMKSMIRERAERRIFEPGVRSEALHRPVVALLHLLGKQGHIPSVEHKVLGNMQARNATGELRIPSSGVINAPFNYTRRGAITNSPHIDYGYFAGLQDAFLPAQVESIIHWLASHPERSLILPHDWEEICRRFPDGSRESLRPFYEFPLTPPQRREMRLYLPLCDYIDTHYRPERVPYWDTYFLWDPISSHAADR